MRLKTFMWPSPHGTTTRVLPKHTVTFMPPPPPGPTRAPHPAQTAAERPGRGLGAGAARPLTGRAARDAGRRRRGAARLACRAGRPRLPGLASLSCRGPRLRPPVRRLARSEAAARAVRHSHSGGGGGDGSEGRDRGREREGRREEQRRTTPRTCGRRWPLPARGGARPGTPTARPAPSRAPPPRVGDPRAWCPGPQQPPVTPVSCGLRSPPPTTPPRNALCAPQSLRRPPFFVSFNPLPTTGGFRVKLLLQKALY